MHKILLNDGKPEDILRYELINPHAYFNKLREEAVATNEPISNIYSIKKMQPLVKPGPPDYMPIKPPPPIINNPRQSFPTFVPGLRPGALSAPAHRIIYPPLHAGPMLTPFFSVPPVLASPFVFTGKPMIYGDVFHNLMKTKEKTKLFRENRVKDKIDEKIDESEKIKESEPYKKYKFDLT